MNTGGPETRLIDNRFALLQRLGGGGMGLVWRARDTALDREVALKEVRPPDLAMAADSGEAQQMRERVLREARALARLQHPNVVIIHHIVDAPEYFYPWLVMELVSGGSLADRLERGPLTVPEAARIGRGVLSALRSAHAAGVQHRDVKPGNVLLRADGTPVLTDFGIAAMHDATALTATGSLIGSPEFIAPERIRGVEGNPSSDLWSLGMMLYVAVEGHHPLRRATTLATLAAVLDEPLPPPACGGPLGALLSRLLAKDPSVRPDAEQLDRLLAEVEQHSGTDKGTMPIGRASWGPAFADTPRPGPQGFGPPPATIPPGTMPQGAMPQGSMPQGAAPQGGMPSAPTGPPTGPNGPGATGPAGWMQQGTRPVQPVPHTPRKRRGRTVALSATGVVAVLAVGWGVVFADGGSGGTGTGPQSVASAPSDTHLSAGAPKSGSTAAAPSTPTPAAATAATGDLLTPAGVRSVIAGMHPYLSGNKVKELVVYPAYASAEAPTPADPKLYDDITYRDGAAAHSPGGTMSSDDTTVNLRGFDWDVLPALLAKAQKTLNVPHPTSRYIIVGPDLFDGTPTIRVYLSDAYGSGYLSADAKGTVHRTYPRGA